MKLVSFEVAKALKEAGYPQLKADWSYGVYGGELFNFVDADDYVVSAPTYFEVFLWLWREKDIKLQISHPRVFGCYDSDYVCCFEGEGLVQTEKVKDPEEAIEKAIEYLVDNKLLK